MLKRWRNLPRAGVGLLGLALVFMFTLNADASGRNGTRSFSNHQGAMMWGVPEGVDAASSPAITPTPPVVQEFSVAGSTIVNFNAGAAVCSAAGLDCNAGESCQCVQAIGNVTDGVGPIFQGPATFTLNIVTTFPSRQYPNGNTVGKSCFFATGVLAVTPAVGSTINFITSGAACNAIVGGFALYSGGFDIGPSTGGFSSALGAGVMGFGSNFSTKVGVFDIKGAGANLN